MPARHLRASIVVIGDEILGGFVGDTNSGWLARRLHHLGVPLDRVVTVPDSFEGIDEALAAELGRDRPRVVLTSGGIGSTPDDVTFAAVARHLGLDLEPQSEIDAWIDDVLAWNRSHGMPQTSAHERAMRRMALVPRGATLLAGSRGNTPAVTVDVDGGCRVETGATIVVLPGVPSVLQHIVTSSVEPGLLRGRGHPEHVAEVEHTFPESLLAPLLERLVADFPALKIGSYPATTCTIRLQGAKAEVEQARAQVEAEVASLERQPGADRLRAAWRARWSS